MRADLLVKLAELPGFDPVGLWVYAAGYRDIALDCGSRPLNDAEVETVWTAGATWAKHVTSVSLADAATRDRLARFVAARVGLECGATAPAVRLSGWDHHDGTKTRSFWLGDSDWSISGAELPALLDLVDNDDTRLPDGARRVDCEALGLVARHVAAEVQP